MKQAKFVAYEQNVIVYKFLTQKVCFDTMALLAWWSAPETKLTTKFNNNYFLNWISALVKEMGGYFFPYCKIHFYGQKQVNFE